MKRMLVGVLGALLVSAVGLYAQAKPAAPADQTKPAVFTGCLVPGTDANSYMLLKGKEKGQKDKEAQNYFLVEADKKDDLEHFKTMEVEVTGTASVNGTKHVIAVQKVKRLSDYCG